MVNKYKNHNGSRTFLGSGMPLLLLSFICLVFFSTNALSSEAGIENLDLDLNPVKNASSDIAGNSFLYPFLNIDLFRPKDFLYNVTFGYLGRLSLLEDWRIFKVIAPISQEVGEKIDVLLKSYSNDPVLSSDETFGDDMASVNIFCFRNGSACFLLRSLSDDGSSADDIFPTCVGIGIIWKFY